jgi:hypothetical protein
MPDQAGRQDGEDVRQDNEKEAPEKKAFVPKKIFIEMC